MAGAASTNILGDKTTTNSFNTIIHGVAGRAAVAFGGAFYAYIHDIADHAEWRIVIIFASRELADEWWRAVSTSDIAILKNNIKRVTPQFYTHNTRQWNFHTFFTDYRVQTISDKFRGKMFLVLENTHNGRGITIIPTQTVVDRSSGDWFTIRSKANADQYWYYDRSLGSIVVSVRQRSSFKISAPNMHDGAIMIGLDDITLVVQHHGFVKHQTLNGSPGKCILGVTDEVLEASKFKFKDLDEGKFIPLNEDLPVGSLLCYMSEGTPCPGWELAL